MADTPHLSWTPVCGSVGNEKSQRPLQNLPEAEPHPVPNLSAQWSSSTSLGLMAAPTQLPSWGVCPGPVLCVALVRADEPVTASCLSQPQFPHLYAHGGSTLL